MIKFELESDDKEVKPLFSCLDREDGDLNLRIDGKLILWISKTNGNIYRYSNCEENQPSGLQFENCGKIKIGDIEEYDRLFSDVVKKIMENIRREVGSLTPTNPIIFDRVSNQLRLLQEKILGDS